ncbi:MAG TPA: hypothetical protein VN678_03735 [Acidobacteriaceae bacterium]|nr:hypothetical protein [Acidobacteriaceae bacterium]
MLPGIAAIAMYMLVVAIVGAFGSLRGTFPPMIALPICTLIVVGVFGLLRMRRWGWALVTAGSLLFAFAYSWIARRGHIPGLWVMAALDLCMFLYLIRTEVRDRLR